MTAMSAMVALGGTGWDPGVQVAAMAELHEADRICWLLRVYEDDRVVLWDADPEALVRDLFAMVAIHLIGTRDEIPASLLVPTVRWPWTPEREAGVEAAADHFRMCWVTTFVTAFEGSSLCGQLADFEGDWGGDLSVHRAVYERWNSQWPGVPGGLEGDITFHPLAG